MGIESTQANNQSLTTHTQTHTHTHIYRLTHLWSLFSIMFLLSSSLLNVNKHFWSTFHRTYTYAIQIQTKQSENNRKNPLMKELNKTKPPILSFRVGWKTIQTNKIREMMQHQVFFHILTVNKQTNKPMMLLYIIIVQNLSTDKH